MPYKQLSHGDSLLPGSIDYQVVNVYDETIKYWTIKQPLPGNGSDIDVTKINNFHMLCSVRYRFLPYLLELFK